jgi:isoleucyl-tRNA synthetase
LYKVLLEFSKAAAPVIPFMSENVYRALLGGEALSVHLCDYPKVIELSDLDRDLITRMKMTRDVVSVALAIRTVEGIKVRQPLEQLIVAGVTAKDLISQLIMEEVNVKNIDFTDTLSDNIAVSQVGDIKVKLNTIISEELRLEGLARELVRSIQDKRKELGLSVSNKIKVIYPDTIENTKIFELFGEEIKNKVAAESFDKGTELIISRV